MQRGEAWAETWRFLDRADGACDLTGCTGEITFSASGGVVLATGSFTPDEDVQGNAALALDAEDVDLFDAHRVLHWALLITDSADVEHVARGTVRMLD